jgi:hypothetical protein
MSTYAVNTPIKTYFKFTTGVTSFPDFAIVNNGTLVVSPSVTIAEVSGTGIYCVTYTPLATGTYAFHVNSAIYSVVDIVSRTDQSYLANIEDECLGSWVWNKQAGTLTTYRQDGTLFHTYTVIETITDASRELVS